MKTIAELFAQKVAKATEATPQTLLERAEKNHGHEILYPLMASVADQQAEGKPLDIGLALLDLMERREERLNNRSYDLKALVDRIEAIEAALGLTKEKK